MTKPIKFDEAANALLVVAAEAQGRLPVLQAEIEILEERKVLATQQAEEVEAKLAGLDARAREAVSLVDAAEEKAVEMERREHVAHQGLHKFLTAMNEMDAILKRP